MADGLIRIPSSFGLKQAIDRLETEAMAKGLTIFARIDHAAGAAQVGLPLRATKLHRHNANAFIYVLEGSVIMQVKRSEPVTLHPGQTFYEGPDDIHVVGRNASKTEPAKFLVVFVKNKGAPILTPVQ